MQIIRLLCHRCDTSLPIGSASFALQHPYWNYFQDLSQLKRKRDHQRKAALDYAKWRRAQMRSERGGMHAAHWQGPPWRLRAHRSPQVQQQDWEPVPTNAQHMQDPLPAPQVTDSQPEPFRSLLPLSSESMLTRGFDPHSGPREFDIEGYTSHQGAEQQQRAWAGSSQPRCRQTSLQLLAGENLQLAVTSRNHHRQLEQRQQHHHPGQLQTQLQSQLQLPLPDFQTRWGQQDHSSSRSAHTQHGNNLPELIPHFPLTRDQYQ